MKVNQSNKTTRKTTHATIRDAHTGQRRFVGYVHNRPCLDLIGAGRVAGYARDLADNVECGLMPTDEEINSLCHAFEGVAGGASAWDVPG